MKKFPIETGSIVISMAGRDEGRRFLVMKELDQDFVLITNGELRGVERPKKKRRKHLKPTGEIDALLAARWLAGEAVEDHEIRKRLMKEED